MVTLAHRPPAPPRRGQAGYTLVMLMVLVTVLNVLVAAALPAWTAMQQRDKEEELIFRGLQYAEAIRVFQSRFGRLPVRLEELIEVEPRSIRQLWKDPLTGKNDWGLIFASAGGGAPQPGSPNPSGEDLTGGSGLRPSSGGGETVTQGPIVGVFSRAKGDSIKTFNGKDTYSEWQFTVELISQKLGGGQPQPGSGPGETDANGRRVPGPGLLGVPPNAGGLIPPGGGPPDLSSRWIGRPWPPELQTLVNGSAPNPQQGQAGGGNGAGGSRAGGAGGGGQGGGPRSRSQ